jgi:protein-tyrosine phosphatase
MSHNSKSILFLCSGNIFRSVVAEYALKASVAPESGYVIGSAGIEARPQPIHPFVCGRMMEKGVDVSGHRQRLLTRELVEGTDLLIAMGANHREFVRRSFGREVPLFNQVCFEKDEPILDVDEAVPEWQVDLTRARDYILLVIEHIWQATPVLLTRLPHF